MSDSPTLLALIRRYEADVALCRANIDSLLTDISGEDPYKARSRLGLVDVEMRALSKAEVVLHAAKSFAQEQQVMLTE